MATPSIPSTSVNRPTAPARPKAPQARPAANAPANNGIANDTFDKKPPSAEALASARSAIAALATMPAIPLSNQAKTAWLDEANKRLAAADKAASLLEDASFWTHGVPTDEADKARSAVNDFSDRIQTCKERAGLAPAPRPLNPFRPLHEAEKNVTGGMNNPVGGVIGVILLPAAVTVDMVDLVTRPLQAVAYPFEWAWYGVKKAGRGLGVG